MNKQGTCLTDGAVKRPVAPPRLVAALPPGSDLLAELRLGYHQLFCIGRTRDPLCRRLDLAMARYRKQKVPPLRAFLRKKLPAKLPQMVLYPFSGGDILAALTAFPEQRRYVLLSLEQGGSPTPMVRMSRVRARRAQQRFLFTTSRMLMHDFSHTVDLQEPTGKRLPGLLPLILFGLRTHGAEPTGMRTFRISAQGEVVYFHKAELVAAGPWPPREEGKARYGRIWSDPQYNRAYSHIEVRFRLAGDTADRVLQHVAADLSNPGLLKSPGLDRFLARLGPHNLMIKAASYLLWKARYSDITTLILHKASVLVGDTSSPLPDQLRRNGLKVQAFGRFRCPVLRSSRPRAGPWRREFLRQKPPLIRFRFGYGDCKRQNHLILGIRG
ncbi:MAG: hypothetical protein ABI333_09180 [bacterium]